MPEANEQLPCLQIHGLDHLGGRAIYLYKAQLKCNVVIILGVLFGYIAQVSFTQALDYR